MYSSLHIKLKHVLFVLNDISDRKTRPKNKKRVDYSRLVSMINLDRYIEAWKLRQQKKTYKQIGVIMKVSSERVRVMVNTVNYKRQRNGKKALKIIELG